MGSALSNLFSSNGLLVSNHRGISDLTRDHVRQLFEVLRANPRINIQRLEGFLQGIPKCDNILLAHNGEGYNLLQKCIGINNVDLVRWICSRNPDLNRSACSFPLHIACLKGHEQIVELLLKHGARVDVEARMCWPGPHSQNCEERGKYSSSYGDHIPAERTSDKLQNAISYAIDGDQVGILELLIQTGDEHWFPWQAKRPLLHIACDRGALNCCRYLVEERPEEVNLCFDEYYPIHQAALHDVRFVELLISCGAQTTVRTATQQMTALHILYLIGRKSAQDTLATTRLLLDNGMRECINEADSLGNTPLHGLIVRYALEEARFGYDHDNQPWNKWDVLHLVRYLLQNGARPSINQPGNSALACVLRHVRDWEFRYELINMLLQEGGNPNFVGRDGSVPLMVCLVPLINKDPLHHFNHNMKVCYLNCVRILCKHGASPNCSSRSNLTPLHVLMFTASESIALSRQDEKAQNFEFIRSLLIILLQHGLDPNVRFSQKTPHILPAVMGMVTQARSPGDLIHVHSLTLALLQHGADPNIIVPPPDHITICNSQSCVLKRASNHVLYYYIVTICRKEDITMDPAQNFVTVIMLFYLCMEHRPLFSCLKVIFTALHSGIISVKGTALLNVIRELYATPRTLKQICRVTIYKALNRCPGEHANKLPLPPALKDYLLSFEP
ncbi:ankyrin-1 [Thrips palmi]|uniref:Ankyrin-1 n=1 Tax=Thrips palmi TaxID=161013 RepID=A0A6P8ZLF4_THRPL|nr:ankyrin-1 [Thrips palmi]XP_034238759.1 ankyrin-1 [Thrips palmi]XP_034238760.1 ankyrin-1 [Thrips palmi]